jgi:NAD(P)-dependent dehydrogenase (short-subunit alcohol dehydrogenase family)
MSEFSGKVAVITAGAAGIGEGCARQLARGGADVVIGDIDPAAGERLAREIEGLGRRALFVQADMMQAENAQSLIDQAGRAFGGVDILVNNVGGVRHRPFAEQTLGNWRRVIDLNLISLLAATQAAAVWMRKGGRGGAIVNVASTEALRAAPGFSVYAACKAAMVEFTKTMALELAADGVRVNAIAPDLIDTPGLRPYAPTDPAGIAHRDRFVPLGRTASIEEAGDVVAFLASPRASWVTGVTIPVDGGATAAGGWHRDTAGDWTLT